MYVLCKNVQLCTLPITFWSQSNLLKWSCSPLPTFTQYHRVHLEIVLKWTVYINRQEMWEGGRSWTWEKRRKETRAKVVIKYLKKNSQNIVALVRCNFNHHPAPFTMERTFNDDLSRWPPIFNLSMGGSKGKRGGGGRREGAKRQVKQIVIFTVIDA
jgi:hypothetical protein